MIFKLCSWWHIGSARECSCLQKPGEKILKTLLELSDLNKSIIGGDKIYMRLSEVFS